MPPRLRFGLFLLFFVGFLVSAPLVVLYTAGYRFHLASGTVTQTGLLSISSIPRGARVMIDGEDTEDETPVVFKNLLPGEHVIRLERDGFFPWEKRLTIAQRTTTFATNVPLFVDKPSLLVSDGSATQITTDPSGHLVTYVREAEGLSEVWTLDARTGVERLLTRHPSEQNDALELRWSANGTYVSVHRRLGTVSHISIFRVDTGEQTLVSDHLERVEEGWWDAARDDRFFIRTDVSAFSFDVTTQVVTSLAVDAVAVRSEGDDMVIAQNVMDRTIVSRTHETTSTLLAYLPLGTYVFEPAPQGLLLLRDTGRNRLVLLDASSGDQPILLNTDARLWQWEPEGRRLLYSNGFDIHIYDANTHTDDTLTRLSSLVTGVAWYPPGGAILYTLTDGAYALELDYRSNRQTFTLETGTDFRIVVVDDRGRSAYFFGIVDEVPGLYHRPLQR